MFASTQLPFFSSPAAFRAYYEPVTDFVFLYNPTEHQILEANLSFRSALEIAPQALLPVLNFNIKPRFRETSISQTQLVAIQQANKLPLQLTLHHTAALLGEVEVLLCIGKAVFTPEAKNEVQMLQTEQQQTRKEVYHRLKNQLNVLISLLSLQLGREREEPVKLSLKKIKSRLYMLALLQERLSHLPKKQEIKANDFIMSVAQSCIAEFSKANRPVKLQDLSHECWLVVDAMIPLGLIVHELVSNAVLHAFEGGDAGTIALSLQPAGPGYYQLLVQDNGLGFPEGANLKDMRSLGAQLLISLSRQLKGRLEIQSSRYAGTRISLNFPSFNK